ncbi:MAG TPA: cyclodeaminase/cyclohydrolase family protein [Ktedonobacteraceae bacterium]|nr:cyclodeaminase/cyclohydrolase family protein [Ktedonobacteraceae bacterium]
MGKKPGVDIDPIMEDDQKMYIDEPLHSYLDDLATAQPTPGGGSTAALSGAMGAALASMVCRITIGKETYADVQQEIEELLRKTEYLRSRFQQLMQEDIEAYGHLSASYKLPRATSEERKYRTDMIQKQLVEAASVPLEVVKCAAELIQSCQRIAEVGSVSVLSDVATGAILASCSGEGAAFMVRINVRSMNNETLVVELENRLHTALAIIAEGVNQVKNIVEGRA